KRVYKRLRRSFLVYFLSYFVFLQQNPSFPILAESDFVRVQLRPSRLCLGQIRLCLRLSLSHLFSRLAMFELRKIKNTEIGSSDNFNFVSNSVNNSFATNFKFLAYSNGSFYVKSKPNCVENKAQELEQMENQDRILKELAKSDMVYKPSCIQYPLIHLLPKFHNVADEDPHKHMKEFHVLVLFRTWGDMKHMFLEKFFPMSKIVTIRKEICGIGQHSGETLHEYWERFNRLCLTCSHHQISKQLLIQYFYEGLMMMDRSMIDATRVEH
ncbi:hypothetical protein CR513_27334, partial [Mucuna pruriens]